MGHPRNRQKRTRIGQKNHPRVRRKSHQRKQHTSHTKTPHHPRKRLLSRPHQKALTPSPFSSQPVLSEKRATQLLRKWMHNSHDQTRFDDIRGHFTRIKFIINTFPNLVNTRDENKNTALHYAMWKQWFEIISFLVSHKADPLIRNKFGQSPLNCGDRTSALLALGYKENELQQKLEETQEEWDTCFGNNGWPKNSSWYHGIHYAVMFRRDDILERLLARHKPRQHLVDDFLRFARETTTAKLLISAGANINSHRVIESALHTASSFMRPKLVELFLSHGAIVNARCAEFKETPFDYLVYLDDFDSKEGRACATLLLEHGGKITRDEGKRAVWKSVLKSNDLRYGRAFFESGIVSFEMFKEFESYVAMTVDWEFGWLSCVRSRKMFELVVDTYGKENVIDENFLREKWVPLADSPRMFWYIVDKYWYLVNNWDDCRVEMVSEVGWNCMMSPQFLIRRLRCKVGQVKELVHECDVLVVDCVQIVIEMLFDKDFIE